MENEIRNWIRAYTEHVIDELHPTGSVLEVGFGNGEGACRIAHYKPKHHTIIEADPVIAHLARQWAVGHSNVDVIEGRWEDVLQDLGEFDTIFFNDQTNCEAQLIARQNPAQVAQVMTDVKEVMERAQKQLSKITRTFSDQEIDDFYAQKGQFNPSAVPQFLKQLKDNQQISADQYVRAMKKYGLVEPTKSTAAVEPKPSELVLFLQKCLDKHLKKGGKFSCFLADCTSKYEDVPFFNRIITNIGVNYSEKLIDLKIEGCSLEKALAIQVEKCASTPCQIKN